jgi:hypothetical protein
MVQLGRASGVGVLSILASCGSSNTPSTVPAYKDSEADAALATDAPLSESGNDADATTEDASAILPDGSGQGPESGVPIDSGGIRDSGGNPEVGPPNPRPCSAADSGVMQPGVWESVTPPQVNLAGGKGVGILNVKVNPQDPATVYTTADQQGLYRSRDCGATWTKVSTGRNGFVLDTGWPWTLEIDPIDPNVIYSDSLYGRDNSLLKSTNGGVDWDSLFPVGGSVRQAVPSSFFQGMSMDPTDHRHIVVSFHDNCVPPYSKVCLGESMDAGATWRIFNGPPTLTGWTEEAGPLVVDHTSFFYAAPFTPLLYTTDSGATWREVSVAGYWHMHRASDGFYYMGTRGLLTGGMQRSKDLVNWSPIPRTPVFVSAGLVGDGHRLFAASRRDAIYVTALESDGFAWNPMPAPPAAGHPVWFALDPVHHILYSANQASGLWRMATP